MVGSVGVLVAGMIAIGFLYVILHWQRMRRRRSESGLRGPPIYPVIGTGATLIKHGQDYLQWIVTTTSMWGKTWEGNVFGLRVLFTSDPNVVEEFLVVNFKKTMRFTNAQRFYQAFGTVGAIFSSNGDHWKSLRSTAKPLFRGKSLSHMVPVFLERASALASILEESIGDGLLVDIQELFYRYTLDSIGEIGFGFDVGSLNEPVPFSTAFDHVNYVIDQNFRQPHIRYLPDRAFDKSVEVMDEFVLNIIRKRRQDSEAELQSRTDLLSKYLLMNNDDGLPFSDRYLRDVLINLFIAGRDTTATLLTWSILEMSKHPEVQEKILEELQREFPDTMPTSHEELKRLTYMEAVLNEVLRLYPPVPDDGRVAAEDQFLSSIGVHLKKGDLVVYGAWTIHRDPDYWENPLEFNPDRWVAGSPSFKPLKHKYQFVPFHAGGQLCLGSKMAYIEAKSALLVLLPRLRLEVVDPDGVFPVKNIVLRVRDGFSGLQRRTEVDHKFNEINIHARFLGRGVEKVDGP